MKTFPFFSKFFCFAQKKRRSFPQSVLRKRGSAFDAFSFFFLIIRRRAGKVNRLSFPFAYGIYKRRFFSPKNPRLFTYSSFMRQNFYFVDYRRIFSDDYATVLRILSIIYPNRGRSCRFGKALRRKSAYRAKGSP